MKNIVRAVVLTLALTGAFASTHTNGSTAATAAGLTKTSAMPVPSCPPGDPNGCGIADIGS
jgi:hypothetical protein